MTDDLEKKRREIYGTAHEHEMKFRDWLRRSDGPLTAKGRAIDYGESHTVEIALGLTVLGYIVSGAWLAIYLVLGVKALWGHYGKTSEAHALLKQIATEFHYYVVTGAGTTLIFEYAGYNPPDLPIGVSEIISTLLVG